MTASKTLGRAPLKLTALHDDKPVKVTIELEARLHRDLVAYAEAFAAQTGQTVEPQRLIAPMLARFIASDRGFTRGRSQAD
ncbi:small protein [Brevundimonas sp. LM2]|uniref:DUF2274 domain-containing protein n=1 Tax=Brevundimonas sp. LM2 TaxID=1938605 RepID=UPI000983F589|nr:DUF2274 domain-containing protein [Brevundimonas sp. LM2]AQR61702.1 small protein [Brevundimonas sp. LM2]